MLPFMLLIMLLTWKSWMRSLCSLLWYTRSLWIESSSLFDSVCWCKIWAEALDVCWKRFHSKKNYEHSEGDLPHRMWTLLLWKATATAAAQHSEEEANKRAHTTHKTLKLTAQKKKKCEESKILYKNFVLVSWGKMFFFLHFLVAFKETISGRRMLDLFSRLDPSFFKDFFGTQQVIFFFNLSFDDDFIQFICIREF